ncbi:MAG: M15 family metallopeptidase, partial [Bosea sp. (in: a-proteobacteria)]
MESPDKRRVDYGQLHPLMRDKVKSILKKLNADGYPFELFEAYRTPARQRYLYQVGRTRELSRKPVTNARPWQSFHQYGLAVDIILNIKGKWSWDTSGKNAAGWDLLQKYGKEAGLRPVPWEKPHLEWAGAQIKDLIAGHYPDGGD